MQIQNGAGMMVRKKLIIAGGDRRMQYAGEYLSEQYDVGSADKMTDAPDVILFPAVSADSAGEAEISELLGKIDPDGTVLCGHEKGLIKELCSRRSICYANYMELPELALANAVPTAEAAMKLAIEVTEKTIWQSRVFVAGFGRIGAILTDRLLAMGAAVTAGARKSYDRMRIKAAGALASALPPEPVGIRDTDIIFNTVPAEIWGREHFEQAGKGCVYIELASHPGGAKEENVLLSGVEYVRASGLPAYAVG